MNIERPKIIEEEHLEFLDELRESGVTNMCGAGTYIQGEFYLSISDAKMILNYWMDTFTDRHNA